MRDDPRKNLKWLEQELLAADSIHHDFSKLPDPQYREDDDLLELVDQLIGEEESSPEVPPLRFSDSCGNNSKGARAERARTGQKADESVAVFTKTKKQLRQEEKQRKIAEKKSNINRNLKDLVFLAVLEVIGILCVLGWWFQ